MDFSIVIPAYNEVFKIALDVKAAADFLNQNFSCGEVIVVDDGSDDDTSEKAKEIHIPETIQLKVIRYENNHGKGYAVRTGMLNSCGDIVMFADSGLCIPYHVAKRGIKMIENEECEIAIGSRWRKDSAITKKHLKSRQISSKIFPFFIRLLTRIPKELHDTQCGFKIYDGPVARELFSESMLDGFMFDIEIIKRALIKGYNIKEFPVIWTADPDSRMNLAKMPCRVLKELFKIRNLERGDGSV